MAKTWIILFSFLTVLQFNQATCQPNDEITRKKGKMFRNFASEHPVEIIGETADKNASVRNVILMIGDGMGTSQVYAGLVANKGSLYLTQFPVTGLAKTNSFNNLITDSSAGATAISTGIKPGMVM
jgi:alkaline phosphatase